MPLVSLLIAIPLGLFALVLLAIAVVASAIAGCAAAKWALRRANQAVLGEAGEI
ncbi:MAG: hypothetical protein JST31_12700 [Actinobacteria bacterium]|nr:hypothetical protein [Actinomycetota bacterium]